MLLMWLGQPVRFINALLHVGHQFIQRVEQKVGRMAGFQLSPGALDSVQVRTNSTAQLSAIFIVVYLEDKLISKDVTKDEVIYLTGGWFEEYVFNQVYTLRQEGILDDAMLGIKIQSLSGAQNELDIAFMKDNVFYHLECKTLGDEREESIINMEIYKKGVLSTLLGKGAKKRAFICTTHNQIKESSANRANDYGVEVLNIDQVRNLKNILLERFGVAK